MNKPILVLVTLLVITFLTLIGCTTIATVTVTTTPSATQETPMITVPTTTQLEQTPSKSIPMGKIAFVSADSIHIINPDGTGELRLTEGAYPVWSPDGKKIAFKGSPRLSKGGLYVINADGTNKTKLAENVPDYGYQWSPDGRKIVFNLDEPEGQEAVYLINVDGSNLIKLVDGTCAGAIFSPDGKKIAYMYIFSKSSYLYHLYVMNSDGSGNIRLISDEIQITDSYYNDIRWSPDGSKIVYSAGPHIYTIDKDGNNRIGIETDFVQRSPRWSPDGKRIVYIKHSNSADSVFISNPDGTGKTEIVRETSESIIDPSWSPDGQKIVFSHADTEVIYTVNADGSSLTKLASGWFAEWSPK